MFLRKALLLSGMALLFVMAAGTAALAAAAKAPAAAADSVGIVDIEEVTSNHPGMANARQQMSNLSRQKENEARAAADKETDNAKKAQVVQQKRMELAQEQQKLMDPIFRDCQQAVREVATSKKLSLVLNKSVVLIGGVDITQDVIQRLQRKK